MKIVILADDDVIDGVPRAAGEVLSVPDDYDGSVRRVIAVDIDTHRRKEVAEQIKKIKKRKKPKPEKPGKPNAK